MTKLEELKVTRDAAYAAAYDALDALDAAYAYKAVDAAAYDALDALDDYDAAYIAELNKEKTND